MDNLNSPKSMQEFFLGWYLGMFQAMLEDPAADDDEIYEKHILDVDKALKMWREKYKEEIEIKLAEGDKHENTRDWF